MEHAHVNLSEQDRSLINSTLDISCKFIDNEQFTLALNILHEVEKKFWYIPEILFNIGISNYLNAKKSFEKEDFTNAEYFFLIAEKYLIQSADDKFLPDLYVKLSICYQNKNLYNEVKDCHEKLYRFDSRPDYAAALLAYSKLCCADWKNLDKVINEGIKNLNLGNASIKPFTSLLVSDNPKVQQLAAKNFSKKYVNSNEKNNNNFCFKKNKKHNKIRIAYLSSDFHNHATAHLIAGMFEKQNIEQFDYYAFSYGKDDNSDIMKRVRNNFENFFNVRTNTEKEIEQMLFKHEIDIAVDLKGHTRQNKLAILKNRPCPVQISYLGYPGTLGTDFIDYLIFDNYVITNENRKYFNENIIYLPDSYQCNDHRKLPLKKLSREDVGLPEDKFILCSLNNTHKYNERLFKVWVQILKKNKNSVLWLLDDKAIKQNIFNFFSDQNISNERIILAPKIDTHLHKSRLALADLFIDSFPCNAHTTASDSLYADLPIITVPGNTMCSRVTGSLLNTLKIDELICKNIEEYIYKINFYINNTNELLKIRKKINKNKNLNVFNAALFSKNIEKAYKKVWDNYLNGKKIADIHIN